MKLTPLVDEANRAGSIRTGPCTCQVVAACPLPVCVAVVYITGSIENTTIFKNYYKPAAIVYLLVFGYLNDGANSPLNGKVIRIHLATPALN